MKLAVTVRASENAQKCYTHRRKGLNWRAESTQGARIVLYSPDNSSQMLIRSIECIILSPFFKRQLSYARRMTSQGPRINGALKSGDLPVEVWAKIASYLSLKQWAKASGTCRSTRLVRLQNLGFSRGLPEKGASCAVLQLTLAKTLLFA